MKSPSLKHLTAGIALAAIAPKAIAENKAECVKYRDDGSCVTQAATVLPPLVYQLLLQDSDTPERDLNDMTNPDGSLNGRALNIIRNFDQQCPAIDNISGNTLQPAGEIFKVLGRRVRDNTYFILQESVNQSAEKTEKSALEGALARLEQTVGGCEVTPTTILTPGGQLTPAGQAEANRLAHEIHGLSSVNAYLTSATGSVIFAVETDPHKICSQGSAGGLRPDRTNATAVLRSAIESMTCR